MVYNKNLSIELLRFLLSVFVVFHHQAWLVFGKTFDLDSGFQYAFYLFQGSVDVFFVISGFYTIKSILNKKPFEFLRHRFARIFPLYTLVCIAVAVVAIYKPSLFNSMPTENIIEILSKSIFFIPFKIDSFQGPILSVGWTLNYEVWFYIFIFLSSIIFKSVKILYIFTCYFVLTLFFIFIKQEKFIFNFIWLEFIMGMFLYQKFEFINTLFNRHKIFFHFMLLFVLFGLAFFEVEIFVSNWRFLFGFIGVLIFLVFVNLNVANSITKILGEMSYPIYLFHLPILYAFYRFNIIFFWGGVTLVIISLCGILLQREINKILL